MSALERPHAFVDMSRILRFLHSKETFISCPHIPFSLMCQNMVVNMSPSQLCTILLHVAPKCYVKKLMNWNGF